LFNKVPGKENIAVLFLGNPAPGGNNIIDGLLRFQNKRKSTNLWGYLHGIAGLIGDKMVGI